MSDPTLSQLQLVVPIVAALAASVLTAVLTFGVRYYLDTRDRQLSERRLALVFLHEVTDVCAMGTHIKRLVRIGLGPPPADLSGGEEFDISHAIAVLLADGIRERGEEARKSIEPMIPIMNAILTAPGYHPSAEDLSRMPKGVMAAARDYHGEMAMVQLVVQRWIDYFKTGDGGWISAAVIQQHWTALRFLYFTAEQLRKQLVKQGVATEKEAAQMLSRAEMSALMRWAIDTLDKNKVSSAAEKHSAAA